MDYSHYYDGTFSNGFLTNVTPFLPTRFEGTLTNPDVKSYINVDLDQITENLRLDQKNNLKIVKSDYSDISTPKSAAYSHYNYGISHECEDFDIDYPGELPDDYWEPDTGIDIGIYRYLPSEATVKSDLQYYNKDYVRWPSVILRDTLAYNVVADGGPEWSIDASNSYLYPSEVAALWYYSYDDNTNIEIDVYPYDCIIIADVCFGYYLPPSSDPIMAKAFVDYGADAFCGAIVGVPDDSDEFMRDFWNDLCDLDENVLHALVTLCSYEGEWTAGIQWRIYGDSSATLSN